MGVGTWDSLIVASYKYRCITWLLWPWLQAPFANQRAFCDSKYVTATLTTAKLLARSLLIITHRNMQFKYSWIVRALRIILNITASLLLLLLLPLLTIIEHVRSLWVPSKDWLKSSVSTPHYSSRDYSLHVLINTICVLGTPETIQRDNIGSESELSWSSEAEERYETCSSGASDVPSKPERSELPWVPRLPSTTYRHNSYRLMPFTAFVPTHTYRYNSHRPLNPPYTAIIRNDLYHLLPQFVLKYSYLVLWLLGSVAAFVQVIQFHHVINTSSFFEDISVQNPNRCRSCLRPNLVLSNQM